MNKKIILVFFILLIFLSVFGIFGIRDYSMPKAEIIYVLNENRTIEVTEKITYQLNGEFNELYRQLPWDLKYYNASGYCIGKECSFYTKKNGDYKELILKSNYKDEEITVVFNYIIDGHILLQKDCTQFFYKLWGENWEKKIGIINATIYLPKESENLIYFIHPISENIDSEIEGNRITIISSNHPAETYLEINLLMPKEMFNDLKIAKNYMTKNEIILMEEQEIAKEKNFQNYSNLLLVIGGVIAVFIALVFLYLYLKYGRDRPVNELGFFGPYEHEPPGELSPALALYLINFDVNSNAIVAEILYLVNKKYLNMSEIEVEVPMFFGSKKEKRLAFAVNEKMAPKNLNAYQQEILRFIKDNLVLREEGKYFFFEDLKSHSMKKVYQSFTDAVKNEFKKLNYLHEKLPKTSIKIIALFFIIVIPIPVFMLLSEEMTKKTSLVFIILFIKIFLLIFISILRPDILGKWSDEGRIANHRWNNFRKYLSDETLMEEKKPMDIIIWEKYLIYGTAFGVSKKVLSALKLVSPEKSNSAILHNPVLIGTALQSMSLSIRSASGASRGGGGFGGGGGGGGGGAR